MEDFDHLTLLGVDLSAPPKPERMPRAFNLSASREWKEALNSDIVRNAMKKRIERPKAWELAIRQFLAVCAKNGVYPFTGKPDFEQMATRFLRNARHTLADYIKSSGLLSRMKIKSVSRDVSLRYQNFTINVVAKLRPIEDPTMSAWLTQRPQPGFASTRDGYLAKSVHAHVDVRFQVIRGEPTLSYHIHCVSPLRLADPKYSSRAKMTEYVDKKLWLPLIREIRLEGAGSRLF